RPSGAAGACSAVAPDSGMSALQEAVDDYVAVRRSLSFKLKDYPWLLGDLVAYAEAAGASTLTSELAVSWALRPGKQAHPSYLSKRLSVARGDGVLAITSSKFNKSRELPLHPSTVRALRDYAKLRDELCGEPKPVSFFVSTLGTRLVYVTVQQVFSRLVRAAGLRARSASCRPRIHDTRHTFASTTI